MRKINIKESLANAFSRENLEKAFTKENMVKAIFIIFAAVSIIAIF